MSEDEAFRQAVDAVYTTFSAFGSGDASPFAALWSQRDDVTIFGGFGAYERGWAAVGPRLDWAARRFGADGQTTRYEPLAAGSSGDLGYAVGLERSEGVRLAGQDAVSSGVLRVTHLFRREDGAWRIIHRHADPIAAKTAPEAILPRDATRE
jgi:ketosteroid isomerase-like protein